MYVQNVLASDSVSSVNNVLNNSNRGDGASRNNKPSYDVDAAGKQITRDNKTWNGTGVLGKEAEVSYSFPEWQYNQYNVGRNTKLSAFTQQQQEQAELALQSWSDLANITFVKKGPTENTNITFGNYVGQGQAYAMMPYSYAPRDYRGHSTDGQAWFNINYSQPTTRDGLYANLHPELGNYGRLTITHEIGHTLGLNHPGNYNAGQGNPSYRDASYAEDTRQYSSMSYWAEANTGGDNKGYFAAAPLMDDIAAIQRLYGANMETRSGDTVYGFHSNSERDFFTINNSDQKAIFAVWDAGGNDTFDFSGYSQNQNINLNEASFSDVGGMKKNVSIAKGVTLENAIGGSGNDVIVGNAVENSIDGGGGNDTIYGGAGQDVLRGGAGADIFVYTKASDSTAAAFDKIMDFETGIDKIDFSFFNKTAGQPGFIHFSESFTGVAGEVVMSYDAQNNTSDILLNIDNDGVPDLKIQLVGHVDAAHDFIM